VRRAIKFLPYERTTFLRGQAIALSGVALATGLRALTNPLVPDGLYFTFLFPVLVATSMLGGVLAGCTTALFGGLVSAYLWVPPAGLTFRPSEMFRLLAFWSSAALIIGVCGLTRIILQELHEARGRAQMLSREMQHRVKNSLMMASAIARQSIRTAASAKEGEEVFQARLMALSRAQELLGDEVDGVVDLRSLLDEVLAPFDPARFTMKGVKVPVPSDVGVSLALLVHEMATNASKYGGLSVEGGTVGLRWAVSDGQCKLDWEERGGPPVGDPVRKGFGTRLMQAAFPRDRGAASVAYEPDGVRCSATFPVGSVIGASSGLETR
jgi:two-component sensor histidine kinase